MRAKAVIITSVSVFLLVIIGIITACSLNGHAHTWSNWQALDATSHERECSGCGEKEVEEHQFVDGRCEVCGYELIVPVENITLNTNKLTIVLNQNDVKLTYQISPVNATNQNVIWSTSNEKVVSVSLGVLKAVGIGQATITIKTEDGEKTASCEVIVVDSISEHTHNLTKVEGKEATCLLAGNVEYYYCEDCGLYFSDASGTEEISKESVAIPALGHNVDSKWYYDATNHYHKCLVCGDKLDEAEHEMVDGKCLVCGYEEITYEDTNKELNYNYFIEKYGTTSASKTTIDDNDGYFTISKGVYFETSNAGLSGPVVNTQGKLISFLAGGDLASLSATIKGASGNGSTLSLVNIETDEEVYTINISNGQVLTIKVDNLLPGKYEIRSVNSIRIAQLMVVEHKLPHVCSEFSYHAAVPATCMADGNIEYWECNECQQKYADEAKTSKVDNVIIAATGHQVSTTWSYNESEHWKICINCSEKLELGTHDLVDGKCIVCSYVPGHTHNVEKLTTNVCAAHQIDYWYCESCDTYFLDELCQNAITFDEIMAQSKHNLIYYPRVDATCEKEGNVEYYYCKDCHKYFSDSKATLEVTEITLSKVEHELVQKYDAQYHYNQCIMCGSIFAKEAHQFDENHHCQGCDYYYDPIAEEMVLEYGSYEEGLYAILDLDSTDGLKAYYALSGTNNYYEVATDLIRLVNNQVRIDIIGVSAGNYVLKLEVGDSEIILKEQAVAAYDRSGYAHFNYSNGIGAYLDDGTLKDNAVVIYVTDTNKNDISDATYKFNKTTNSYTKIDISKYFMPGTAKSIGYLLNNRQYSDKATYGIRALCDDYGAVAIRIIGKVTAEASDPTKSLIEGLTAYDSTENGGSVGDNGRMARISDAYNLTIEGIGPDAQMFGWGVHFIANTGQDTKYGVKMGESFEVRNITFANYPEDAVGMEGIQEGSTITVPVQRCWIHNNTFLPGYCGKPAESDKAEGDGSCDFKRGMYYTFSYNYLEGCHKTNLIGSSNSSLQYNISMHHNWWYNCSSRIPLTRQANVHYYNNYISATPGSTLSYVMSPRANCYIFAENNYFDGCKNIISGSGGTVKFFGNTFYACYDDIPTQVLTREQEVTNKCGYNGIDYSTFDTDAKLFYYNDYYLTDSVTARQEVIIKAGVHNQGPQEAPVMNETTPTASLSIPEEGLKIDLSQVSKGAMSIVNNVVFTNITGTSSGTIKGKGQLVTFTLTSEAELVLDGSGSGAAAGEIIDTFGKSYASKINGTVRLVLPAGTYVIASGIKDKEFTITSITFNNTAASSELRVNAAIEAINNLPNNITINDQELVNEAKLAYDALTDTEKKEFSATLVTKLEDAINQLNALLVANVEQLINEIGEVTVDSYIVISAARTAYNSLYPSLQGLVKNYTILVEAEETFASFAVESVAKQINNLTNVDSIDITNSIEVNDLYNKYLATNEAYLALEEQMKEIPNNLVNKLENGLKKLEAYVLLYEFKVDLLAYEGVEITLAMSSELNQLKNTYESFTAEQLSLLSIAEKELYTQIMQKLEELNSVITVISFGDEATNYANCELISVVGNTSDSKGSVIYNGQTYTTCLKIESSTKIEIIVNTKQKLTIYTGQSAGKRIKINGENHTIGSDGNLTIEVEENVTITKGDTANIFIIELAPLA